MYTELDVVGCAEGLAETAALADREVYLPFIEAAERFASEKGLIVGGAGATRLLIGAQDGEGRPPVGLDSFQYDFYAGEQARALCDSLADALYAVAPGGLGHYVTARPGPRRVVSVDGRDLFTVAALPAHRGMRVADVVIPSERPAQFARGAGGAPLPLQCMGPEIQLMGVYATLCNPGKAGEWGGLLAAEASLRAIFGREIRPKLGEAVKRAEGGRADSRRPLFRALRDEYGGGPGRVLIGAAALALLGGRDSAGVARLQFVTDAPLEGEAREIAAIARRAGAEVEWAINDPKVPTDPRLRRLTVKVVEGRDRREPILDVYNAAAHELVPYVAHGLAERARLGGLASGVPPGAAPEPELGPESLGAASGAASGAVPTPAVVVSGGRARGRPRRPAGDRGPATAEDAGAGRAPPASLKVGTPFALMRFRLVDLWTMQVLMRLGAVNPGYAKGVMLDHLREYQEAAEFYERVLARAGSAPEGAAALLTPAAAYVGRLEDPDLALKREAAAGRGPRQYPYMPAQRAREASGAEAAPKAPGPRSNIIELGARPA